MNEYELGKRFEEYLNNSKQQLFKFDVLFKEVESFQGIPDYIGVLVNDKEACEKFADMISKEKWSTTSKILSCLKSKMYHTIEYLEENTGLSKQTLQKDIMSLCKKDLVIQNVTGSYKLSDKYIVPQMQMYAFELKLDNWKRALFQAIRYKTFSEYNYVVMPIDKKELLLKKIDVFRENNVGLLLFDARLYKVEVLYKARKNQSISKFHSHYMKGKILLENGNEKHVSGCVRLTEM